MRIICIKTVIIFSFLPGALYAQEMNTEEQIETLSNQIDELTSLCDSAYGKDIRLVNGKVYFEPNILAESNPFFRDMESINGSVTIRGATFTGIKLIYDIFQDQLIYLDENGDRSAIRILLSKDYATAFTLEEHQFIILDPSTGINIPEKQYFEILFSGKVNLVQRFEKSFDVSLPREFPHGIYTKALITRYIQKGNKLHSFTNRFALYRILADRKNEVKKYRRINRIHNVKKASDKQITGLIEYYNSIIP